MSRYRVHGVWRAYSHEQFGDRISIQHADAVDTRTGTVFQDGAYRVLVDGKPCRRGKGGTVPFYGEVAWSDAQRLASDLFWSWRVRL